MDFCTCEDWKRIRASSPDIFIYDKDYGWLINWIELTNEFGYAKVHRYGIKINYCPMCGKCLCKDG